MNFKSFLLISAVFCLVSSAPAMNVTKSQGYIATAVLSSVAIILGVSDTQLRDSIIKGTFSTLMASRGGFWGRNNWRAVLATILSAAALGSGIGTLCLAQSSTHGATDVNSATHANGATDKKVNNAHAQSRTRNDHFVDRALPSQVPERLEKVPGIKFNLEDLRTNTQIVAAVKSSFSSERRVQFDDFLNQSDIDSIIKLALSDCSEKMTPRMTGRCSYETQDSSGIRGVIFNFLQARDKIDATVTMADLYDLINILKKSDQDLYTFLFEKDHKPFVWLNKVREVASQYEFLPGYRLTTLTQQDLNELIYPNTPSEDDFNMVLGALEVTNWRCLASVLLVFNSYSYLQVAQRARAVWDRLISENSGLQSMTQDDLNEIYNNQSKLPPPGMLPHLLLYPQTAPDIDDFQNRLSHMKDLFLAKQDNFSHFLWLLYNLQDVMWPICF
jgi:hypothetical protein